MNLRAIVRGAINRINPDQPIVLKRSIGYETDENFKQVPKYENLSGAGQVQPLNSGQLKHAASMNVQGVMRSVRLSGNWMGVVRADQKGGDVLTFPQAPGRDPQDWKVFTVFETWPDWCCVGVVLQ